MADSVCVELEGPSLMNLSSLGGSTQAPQFNLHPAKSGFHASTHAPKTAGEARELARALGAGDVFDALASGGSVSAIPRTTAPSAADLLRSAPQSVRSSATDAFDRAARFMAYSEPMKPLPPARFSTIGWSGWKKSLPRPMDQGDVPGNCRTSLRDPC